MPLYRRLPKRGFNNIFRKDYASVNLGRLQQAIDAGSSTPRQPVDAAALMAAGVVRRSRTACACLAKGELKAKLDDRGRRRVEGGDRGGREGGRHGRRQPRRPKRRAASRQKKPA